MFTEEHAHYLIRLYLSWLLTAIATGLAGIMIVLALISWLLDLDELFEASEHALLLLLPVSAYQVGKGASG